MRAIKTSIGIQGRAIALLAVFLSAHSLSAQGTLQFYADMRAPTEVRPGETETTGEGFFALEENVLNGYVRFTIINFLSDLWMEDASGTTIAVPIDIRSELPSEAMCPCDIVVAGWRVELNEDQTSQLMAGEFFIRAESTAIPPNYVTGQLLLIPEPGILSILLLGGSFVCLAGRGKWVFTAPDRVAA